jgi:hypothetical protein
MMGFPKPEPPRKVKARRGRIETKVAMAVRALVSLRDGDCRLSCLGDCRGESEWAHLGKFRRFATRGMTPEQRHTTEGSIMLCTAHHDRYDGRARPRIDIQAASSLGADGRLVVKCGPSLYLEPAR